MDKLEISRKELVQVGNDQVLSKLPVDISFDILSRLPLKTISECRWVCKTWYGLVLHPLFAKTHYARAIKTTSPCVFLRGYRDHYLIDHHVFDNYETSATAYNVKLRGFDQVFGVDGVICYDVLGSVNGLICFSPEFCIYSPSPFYICNPITGEYVLVPPSPSIQTEPLASGFGFDSLTGDYKVIRILKTSSQVDAELYSLGSGTWRVLKNVPDVTWPLPSNVFINGSLHWVTHASDDESQVIISFNVGTEEFNVIQLPPQLNKYRKGIMDVVTGLGVLRGHLCLTHGDFFFGNLEIWVMRDYGVPGSWDKEHLVQRYSVNHLWNGGIQLKEDILVLIDAKGNLSYYDPQKKIYRPIVIHNLNNESLEDFRQPIIQVGSLFSPKIVGNH